MANEFARKMRKSMTRQEFILWRHLRELRRLGFHFRRQAPIKEFIVDFACYHPRVVVELDGSQHSRARQTERDKSRDAKLEADGFRVVRVWNNEVDANLDAVFDRILHELGDGRPPTPVSQSDTGPPHEGEVEI
jgi:very-short-patch-repair endonuclease